MNSNIRLTIEFNNPNLEPEELDGQALQIIRELKDMDEVVSVSRVSDSHPPKDGKPIGGFLVGLLTAEVNRENVQKVMSVLGDRLGGKPIKLKVEANGKKLEVEAYSRKELEVAVQQARDFIAE